MTSAPDTGSLPLPLAPAGPRPAVSAPATDRTPHPRFDIAAAALLLLATVGGTIGVALEDDHWLRSLVLLGLSAATAIVAIVLVCLGRATVASRGARWSVICLLPVMLVSVAWTANASGAGDIALSVLAAALLVAPAVAITRRASSSVLLVVLAWVTVGVTALTDVLPWEWLLRSALLAAVLVVGATRIGQRALLPGAAFSGGAATPETTAPADAAAPAAVVATSADVAAAPAPLPPIVRRIVPAVALALTGAVAFSTASDGSSALLIVATAALWIATGLRAAGPHPRAVVGLGIMALGASTSFFDGATAVDLTFDPDFAYTAWLGLGASLAAQALLLIGGIVVVSARSIRMPESLALVAPGLTMTLLQGLVLLGSVPTGGAIASRWVTLGECVVWIAAAVAIGVGRRREASVPPDSSVVRTASRLGAAALVLLAAGAALVRDIQSDAIPSVYGYDPHVSLAVPLLLGPTGHWSIALWTAIAAVLAIAAASVAAISPSVVGRSPMHRIALIAFGVGQLPRAFVSVDELYTMGFSEGKAAIGFGLESLWCTLPVIAALVLVVVGIARNTELADLPRGLVLGGILCFLLGAVGTAVTAGIVVIGAVLVAVGLAMSLRRRRPSTAQDAPAE